MSPRCALACLIKISKSVPSFFFSLGPLPRCPSCFCTMATKYGGASMRRLQVPARAPFVPSRTRASTSQPASSVAHCKTRNQTKLRFLHIFGHTDNESWQTILNYSKLRVLRAKLGRTWDLAASARRLTDHLLDKNSDRQRKKHQPARNQREREKKHGV